MAKSKSKKITPLMRQYHQVKSKYPDAILLFRVGDFYETFGEDAIKAANILNIVLTNRNNGGSAIELAGFPHHSVDVYLPKLVQAGYRVAICEQLEKPSKEKKIVKRGVTELVTPGLTRDDGILNGKTNNFLAALYGINSNSVGLALLDISTGEFYVSQGNQETILKLVHSFSPNEVLYCKAEKDDYPPDIIDRYYSYGIDDWAYHLDFAREKLLGHFKTNSLKGFGIEELQQAQIAAGAIMHYLDVTENKSNDHILQIQRIQQDEFVWLDRFTIRNLELLHGNFPGAMALIDVMDYCNSPMGSRLLRKWICFPLNDTKAINNRLSAVGYILEQEKIQSFSDLLGKMGDIERLAAKIPSGKISPRELRHLSHSIQLVHELKNMLTADETAYLNSLGKRIFNLQDVCDYLEQWLHPECPSLVAKGNVINDGCSAELDELRLIIKNSQEFLIQIQQKEIDRTGITNLKVGFNNVFGYYLEVTNKYKNQGLIPDDWVRKQTLTNSERYITDELKQIEEKILNAEGNLKELEQSLYDEVIHFTHGYLKPILDNAHVVSTVDVLTSFAISADKHNYHKPLVTEDQIIDIKNGRHPVIERQLSKKEKYVPNDILLNDEDQQILMITGPNMSGKSALLRQTALICLMAQMGSFVPASEATIGRIDKIFTRVGASDNLSQGESTFMVEMNETASILNNVSDRSLILLDEIGRGTSTYDGISIAWAITEFLHDNGRCTPKTLFATHYHELNQLADRFGRIKNFHVSIKKSGKDIIFLRKLKPGGSEHSFGIQVAKMAGMPKDVIQRAESLLHILEEHSMTEGQKSSIQIPKQDHLQLSIFDETDPAMKEIRDILMALDINAMTPIEGLLKLQEFKAKLN